MGCEPRWEEMIQAYLDEELNEEEQNTLEEHIKQCPECAAEFQQAYGFQYRIQTVFESIGTGTDLTARVVEALSPEITQKEEKTEVEEELVGRTIAGYKVLSVLGKGGMGTVYKALQLSMEREVALKVLSRRLSNDKTYVDRFLREARAAGFLNHPNVVRIFDVGCENNIYYFSMEYIRGKTLFEIVSSEGPMDPLSALDITRQVASALAYAHKNGIIHRDIKPENIMLTHDGQVKLTDLGLAKRATTTETDSAVTLAGQVMGTPHYMSPEQVIDTSSVDHRTDIYSLGATLYFMLTGTKPYASKKSAMEVMVTVAQQGLHIKREEIHRIPPPVLRLLRKMTARDPRMRFQTCDQVMKEIDTVKEILTRPSASQPARILVSEPVRKHYWLLWTVGAVAAILIIVLIFSLHSSSSSPEPEKLPPNKPVVKKPSPRPPSKHVQTTTPTPKVHPKTPEKSPPRESVEELAAKRSLENVRTFIAQNPHKVGEALKKLKDLAETYAGTKAAREARDLLAQIEAKLEDDWDKTQQEAERLVKESRFKDAISLLTKFAATVAGTEKEDFAKRKTEAIDRFWRMKSEEALKEVSKKVGDGHLKDALEAVALLDSWCHPDIKDKLNKLRKSVTEKLAAKEALVKLRKLEEEARLFYISIKEAVRKLDIPTIIKEAEARRNSPAAPEVEAFLKDIEAISSVANAVIESLQEQSKRRPTYILLAGDEEPQKAYVMKGKKPFTIRLKMGSADYEISVFRLDKEFFTETAKKAKLRKDLLDVTLAYLEFISGEFESAKALFEALAPGFSEILKEKQTPNKPYDSHTPARHYARVWRTLASEIASYVRRRQIEADFTRLERLIKKARWEEADALIAKITTKWSDVLNEKEKQILDEYTCLVEKKLASHSPSRRTKDETLLALRSILHAASVERKSRNTYVIRYDFSTKDQLRDWLFNGEERGEDFINQMWESLEKNRRLGKKVNIVTLKRWEMVPCGKKNYIKLHDCSITLPVSFKGDVTVEFIIQAVGGWGIHVLVCDTGDSYYAAAIGVREKHLRIKFRRKRGWYLIYAVWKEGKAWRTELVRSFSGLTEHRYLPQRGRIYSIKLVRKGSRIKLYQGSKLVAQGSHAKFKKGRITFRARGDRRFDGYLITSIKITGTPDPEWLNWKLAKNREEKKPPDGADQDDIDDVIRQVKKNCKGVTKEDEERMRSLLEDARTVARWWRPEVYERLKKELLSAKNIKELRRTIEDAEAIRDRFRKGWPRGPGGKPPRHKRGPRGGRKR